MIVSGLGYRVDHRKAFFWDSRVLVGWPGSFNCPGKDRLVKRLTLYVRCHLDTNDFCNWVIDVLRNWHCIPTDNWRFRGDNLEKAGNALVLILRKIQRTFMLIQSKDNLFLTVVFSASAASHMKGHDATALLSYLIKSFHPVFEPWNNKLGGMNAKFVFMFEYLSHLAQPSCE